MKSLILLMALTLSATAFALDSATRQTLEKLDNLCAGNDNGSIGEYDVQYYKTIDVLRELHKSDGDCVSIVSTSKDEAISTLKNALFAKNGAESSCVRKNLTKKERARLARLIDDPSNRAVFSKEWDGASGDSEYCMYANYDIYRADGTLIHIVFNHTD